MAARIEAIRDGLSTISRELNDGESVIIGRSSQSDWRLEGDPYLSRRHVEIRLEGEKLRVKRVSATNPVYYCGNDKEEFTLLPGESFVISKIHFRFITDNLSPGEPAPEACHTMSKLELYSMGEKNDRLRLQDLLELPELLRNKDRADFHVHIASLLKEATGAGWACVMTEDGNMLGKTSGGDPENETTVSKTIIKKALEEAPVPTVYCWEGRNAAEATFVSGVDWAICAAAKIPEEPALIFYVAGSGGSPNPAAAANMENSRFVGAVADMVGRSIALNKLESWRQRLSRFFSSSVASKIINSSNFQDVEPHLAQSTVMFFDIRSFAKLAENDNAQLLKCMDQLRRVMTAMTNIILDERGAVLQYMGDGILACWNLPYEDPDHVNCACRAALRMAAEMGKVTDGWHCGIGIHTGEVVAGAIGSDQVFSYSVLGRVVNQASRIEGITKLVETPVLVTREVAERVSRDAAVPVRMGRYRPAGMDTALELYELTNPPGDPERENVFERGLKALEAGDWEKAYQFFDVLPSGDRAARFLKLFAEDRRRHPPKQWQGIIEISERFVTF